MKNQALRAAYWLTQKKKLIMLTMLGMLILTNLATIYAGTEGEADEAAITNSLACIFCKIANLLFIVTGALAALVIILAGIRWVTAADDPGARNAAKTTIISAFVGLIIILLAVFIVWYVVGGLLPGGSINPTSWITGCGNECTGFGEEPVQED